MHGRSHDGIVFSGVWLWILLVFMSVKQLVVGDLVEWLYEPKMGTHI